MKILVFGSLNIDRTYAVEHFVRAGETLTAQKMELFRGGKGFNQTVALARAGIPVAMAGAVGSDGDFLLEPLKAEGVDTRAVKRVDGASGHAIIQVEPNGGNCIIILAGANGTITHADVDRVLSAYDTGDWVVLQNEISSLDYLIRAAHAKGMTVALNPSPFNDTVAACDFSCVDELLVNEVEAAAIAKLPEGASFDAILNALQGKYPGMNITMTLGHRGSVFASKNGGRFECGIYATKAVDTTAAGDCFTGYFLAERLRSGSVKEALKTAAIASGISVSRKGASPSIPYADEVSAVDRSQIPDTFAR